MCEEVIAEIQQGRLRGKKVASAAGGEYYSFQGIPYAKPPLGDLRFRPPEPTEPWKGVRDATKEGHTAPSVAFGKYSGNEDCLFLNVYTPDWPVKNQKSVMVWIHGGGFVLGSGNTDLYGPDFLVAEDVVVVTLNYRLGALGFLNLEGSDATTNNGLRDQVMALTWVKDNIAQFGGDSGNVTVFGESAGGVSVHCLMLLPLAQGLFHRAIAMSGVAILSICVMPHEVSKQRSFRLAKLLGCTLDDPQRIAGYLRTVPAEEFVKYQHHALTDTDQLRHLAFSFTATEEINGQFLPDHPLKLLQLGHFTRVPFIIGVTSAEGRAAFNSSDLRPIPVSEISRNLDRIVPMDLAADIGTDRSKTIAEELRNFYFGNRSANEDLTEQCVQMATDLQVYSVYTAIKLHLKHPHSPLYVYMFDHETPWESMMFPELVIKSVRGAPHGDDLSYLFFTNMKPNVFPTESAEAMVRSHVVKYWTQFAKTGDVSNITNKLSWPPATIDEFRYLKIQENLTLGTEMFKERMEFLDELYSIFRRE